MVTTIFLPIAVLYFKGEAILLKEVNNDWSDILYVEQANGVVKCLCTRSPVQTFLVIVPPFIGVSVYFHKILDL